MDDQDKPLKDADVAQPKVKQSPESDTERAPIDVIKYVRLVDGLKLRATAMTVDEVAALLKVSSRHVYQLVKDGKIPHFKVGSAVRFDPDDLAAWLQAAGKQE